MKRQDALALTGGNLAKLGKLLNISRSAVSMWGDQVPETSAMRLHMLTAGLLRYDPTAYGREAPRLTKEQMAALKKHLASKSPVALSSKAA